MRRSLGAQTLRPPAGGAPSLILTTGLVAVEDCIVLGFTGTERLSAPYSFRIRVASKHGPRAFRESMMGRFANLSMLVPGHSTRDIQGTISAVRLCDIHPRDGYYRYDCHLSPRLSSLKLSTNYRVFSEQTTLEIVDKLLREHDVLFRMDVSRASRKRPCTIQHGESDFALFQRLLAEDGIYYWFDHAQGVLEDLTEATQGGAEHSGLEAIGAREVVVLADGTDYPGVGQASSQSVGPSVNLSMTGTIRTLSDARSPILYFGSGPEAADEQLTSLECDERVTAEHVKLRAFDESVPLAVRDVTASVGHRAAARSQLFAASDEQDGSRASVRATPTRVCFEPVPPGDSLQDRVRRRVDGEKKRARTLRGRSRIRRLAAGHAFELCDHPIRELNLRYVVTRVHHVCRDLRATKSGTFAYRNVFRVIPADISYAPSLPTVPARPLCTTAIVVPGGDSGAVMNEHGHIRIRFHFQRDALGEDALTWARHSIAGLGQGRGVLAVPEASSEVVVVFDPSTDLLPIIVGVVPNAAMRPPFDLPRQARTLGLIAEASGLGDLLSGVAFPAQGQGHGLLLRARGDASMTVAGDCVEAIGEAGMGSHRTHIASDRTVYVGGTERRETAGPLVETRHDHVLCVREASVFEVTVGGSQLHIGGGREVRVVGGSLEVVEGESRRYLYGDARTMIRDHYDLRAATASLSTTRELVLSTGSTLRLQCGPSAIELSKDGIRLIGRITTDADAPTLPGRSSR